MAFHFEEIAGDQIPLSKTCIDHLWIFRNLAPAELQALSREASKKKLSKGEPIFLQGDPCDEMFLIKGGRVKLSRILEDGRELTLDIRKAGDFIGEAMFSEEGEYQVSAYSLEDTLTCGFNRHQFEQLVLNQPNVGFQIIKNLIEKTTWLTSRIGSLAVSNIEDRLYRVLFSVAKEHGAKSPRGLVIPFPLTHEDLGFLTGAHRVSVTRAMKALKSAGKIICEEKKLILPSPETA